MPGLKVIDGNTIFHDKNADTNGKSSTQSTASELGSTSGEPGEEAVDQAKSTLDLQFRLLRDVEGARYLIPDENCNFDVEKLDTIDEEHKSSQFWLTYTDHHGQEVNTEKRSYIQHFQVTDVEGKVTAKADVDYKIRLEEAPSIELRDWMYKDLLVYLWESRPKFEKVVEEGSEVETEKVVVDPNTELPVIETL